MRRRLIVLVMVAGFAVQGCWAARMALNGVRSNGAPTALNKRGDGGIIAATCMTGFDVCESVTPADHPADLEAWAFTFKEGQRGPLRIPAGEVPITWYVVGPKDRCDRIEATMASAKGTGVGMKGISETCHGPFYFRKERG